MTSATGDRVAALVADLVERVDDRGQVEHQLSAMPDEVRHVAPVDVGHGAAAATTPATKAANSASQATTSSQVTPTLAKATQGQHEDPDLDERLVEGGQHAPEHRRVGREVDLLHQRPVAEERRDGRADRGREHVPDDEAGEEPDGERLVLAVAHQRRARCLKNAPNTRA